MLKPLKRENHINIKTKLNQIMYRDCKNNMFKKMLNGRNDVRCTLRVIRPSQDGNQSH